jgi:hypothetical protein
MHDLQTIVRLNGPVNQRTQALAKAYDIAREAQKRGREADKNASYRCDIPVSDRVQYV